MYRGRFINVALLVYTGSKANWHFIMPHQFGLAFQLKLIYSSISTKKKAPDHIWPWGEFSHSLYYFLLELLALHQSIFERKLRARIWDTLSTDHHSVIWTPNRICNIFVTLILRSRLTTMISNQKQFRFKRTAFVSFGQNWKHLERS